MKEIKDFIEQNNLTFTDKGSSLNSNMVVISGFALHKGVKSSEELVSMIDEMSDEAKKTFDKVFTACKIRNYQNYWETDTAKKLYKF